MRAVFFGRYRTYTLKALALALVLTLVYSVPLAIVHFGTLPEWYQPNVYVAAVVVSTLSSAAIHAYYNSGLVVSCLVAGLQFTPINLAFISTSASVGDPPPVFAVGVFLLVLVAYGGVVGTGGFLLGVGVRETVGKGRR